MFVHSFLEKSALRFPGKVALIHGDARFTYASIDRASNRVANWLIARGLEKGDRVVLLLENGIQYVAGYYGTLKAGAVAVPLNTALKPDGLARLLEELDPKGIITSVRFERLLLATDLDGFDLDFLVVSKPKQSWSGKPFTTERWRTVSAEVTDAAPSVEINPQDLASIIYTSGSTGRPKGAMLTHGNLVANVKSICISMHLQSTDVQMVVLPFFYVMGKSLLNTHFAVGGTVVVNNQFAYLATVIRQMIDEQVTGLSGVPSTYAYLLHRSPLQSSREKLSSLRFCAQAGGHMSLQLKKELRRALPEHTAIYIMYGATEGSSRFTCLPAEDFDDKMESIGKPIPDVLLKVLGADGREVPTGVRGELIASGPNVMQGYWRNRPATERVLDRHGYHTGDIGYRDEAGFFYLCGRKDNLIKVGGHRVNPQEVEDVLMASGQVTETIVLGLPDDNLGTRMAALIVARNGTLDSESLLRFCRPKLAKYKLPARIKFVRHLPKKANGKIDRAGCLKLLE